MCNAALALHLKVLLFLLYNDSMVPSGPFFSPIIINKYTQLIGEIRRWGEEPKGPFPKIVHQTLRTPSNSSRVLELPQILYVLWKCLWWYPRYPIPDPISVFPKLIPFRCSLSNPCSQKNELNNPAPYFLHRMLVLLQLRALPAQGEGRA